jgi:preprotein translocase subunit SecG
MLYTFLLFLYFFIGVVLVLLIAIQKSKGSLGSSRMSGGTAMLFGGSGGQDIFQKTTWTLGALFMAITLWLALIKSDYSHRVVLASATAQQR